MEKVNVQHSPPTQDCQVCRANLSALLEQTLPQAARQVLEDHLADCDECLDVYVKLIDEQEVALSLYIGNRPVWGPLTWGPEEDEEYIQNLLLLAHSKENSGGLVLVKHHPLQEKSLLLLFCVLSVQLKRAGKQVVFADPAETDSLLPLLENGDGDEVYILAPWASQASDFESFLQALALHKQQHGKVVAVLGAGREYGKDEEMLEGAVAPDVYTIPLSQPKQEEAKLSQRLEEELIIIRERLARAEQTIREAYKTVALCDAFGVTVPVRLLAQRLGIPIEQAVSLVDQAEDLLYWVGDDGHRKKARLSTAAPAIARALLPPKEEWQDAYAGLIESAALTDLNTILGLLRQLCQKGHMTLVRDLLKRCRGALSALFQAANAQPHVVYGKILEAVGEKEEAEAIYRKGYERDPTNPYLLHALAVIVGKRAAYGDTEAEKYFKELADLPGQAENPYLWQAWAEHARRRGLLTKAEDYFRKAIALDPDNIPARVGYANLELQRGLGRRGEPYREHAEELLLKARELDCRNVYAFHSLGMLEKERATYGKQAREHFHKAEHYWHTVLRIDPYNVPALNALAVLKKDRGQLRQARDLLEHALEIDPDNLHCLSAWGELWTSVYKDCGRQDAAEEADSALKKVLDIDPENAHALIGSARLLSLLSRYEDAEEKLKKASSLYSDRPDVWSYICSVRGEIALAQEHEKRAEREFRKALRATENAVAVQTELARLLARSNPSEAQRLLTQARKREPNNVVIDNTQAQIEAMQGNTAHARATFERSLSIDEENGYTHFRYAEFLENSGEFEAAERHFQQAQSLGFTLTEMPIRSHAPKQTETWESPALDAEQLYETYGKPLESEQRGKYVAISKDGEVLVEADEKVVVSRALQMFGSGNFVLRRIGHSYVHKVRGGHVGQSGLSVSTDTAFCP